MNRILPQNTPQPTAATIPVSFAEEPVVTFNCFEPNSMKLQLTEEDLVRHTLFIGTTGSGKTTTMNVLLRDLIAYRADRPADKVGLLVVDSKRDDTVAKLTAWAAAAGRAEDLVVLEPGSHWGYNPLAELRSFEDLESVTAKLRSSARLMNAGDGFWLDATERMLDAALTVLLATNPGGIAWPEAMSFCNEFLLLGQLRSDVEIARMNRFEELLTKHGEALPEPLRMKLEGARSECRQWLGPTVDNRTKSCIASCLGNVLKPLRGMSAQGYFAGPGRPAVDMEAILRDGKIVVLSVDAAGNPELANTLVKLAKADYFRLLQGRRLAASSPARLVGIILDEYPLAVTTGEGRYSDITQLQTMRSKRGFMVAATQGFISLDMVAGAAAREALMVNFNNLWFFNTHETQVELFALPLFGQHIVSSRSQVRLDASDPNQAGDLLTHQQSIEIKAPDWVCPLGRLSRLNTGEAFIVQARSGALPHPVWVEPLYFDAPELPPPATPVVDASLELLSRLVPQGPLSLLPDWAEEQAAIAKENMDAVMAMSTSAEQSNLSPATQPATAQAELPNVPPAPPAQPPAPPRPTADPVRPGKFRGQRYDSVEIHITRAELAKLRSQQGLVGRLIAHDPDFRRRVRTRRLEPALPTGEDRTLWLPRDHLHKLAKLPPKTPEDARLIEVLRASGCLPPNQDTQGGSRG